MATNQQIQNALDALNANVSSKAIIVLVFLLLCQA